MKKNFITGCLFLICCKASVAQINSTIETNIQLKTNCFDTAAADSHISSQPTVFLRCATSVNDQDPLFVVDGILVEQNDLKNINPTEILKIEVLKDSAATIFSCSALNGVVIITTRSMNQRKFFISDFSDGAPLPSASVSFISVDTKDTLMFMSNEEGMVITDRLISKKEYTIHVSAVGYKNQKLMYDPAMELNSEILLVRDQKVCEEAVVEAYGGRSISCGSMAVSIIKNTVSPQKEAANSFRVYPNPVRPGSNLNLQYISIEKEKVQAKVTSVNGQLLYSRQVEVKEGKNQFQLPMNTAYSSGVYFVQLVNEKNKSICQQKFFIE